MKIVARATSAPESDIGQSDTRTLSLSKSAHMKPPAKALVGARVRLGANETNATQYAHRDICLVLNKS